MNKYRGDGVSIKAKGLTTLDNKGHAKPTLL